MQEIKTMKKCVILCLITLGTLVIFCFFQKLCMPKYMGEQIEGALIAEYYEETLPHDVLLIGDCEVYENISPMEWWKEYGITSYIRGSAQQLTWQSYYLLEEMLRYETPKVVVFNVLAMKYGEPQKEAYNRMTLDGMCFSSSKWKSMEASMLESEKRIEYLFPLLRYHSRILEITKEDFTFLNKKGKIAHNGFPIEVGVRPVESIPPMRALKDEFLPEVSFDYLDKMRVLCEEKGIALVLIKAPALYPHWYPSWETQIENYAKENQLLYYNFLEEESAIGIDWQVDTYDGGLHLNLQGTQKLSQYFGERLVHEFDLINQKENKEVAVVYEEKLRLYETEIMQKTEAWRAEGEKE